MADLARVLAAVITIGIVILLLSCSLRLAASQRETQEHALALAILRLHLLPMRIDQSPHHEATRALLRDAIAAKARLAGQWRHLDERRRRAVINHTGLTTSEIHDAAGLTLTDPMEAS